LVVSGANSGLQGLTIEHELGCDIQSSWPTFGENQKEREVSTEHLADVFVELKLLRRGYDEEQAGVSE
jgi:hypothetical protein